MCGIFGIGFLRKTKLKDKEQVKDLITVLAEKTTPYGRRAGGVAIATPYRLAYAKEQTTLKELFKKDTVSQMIDDNLTINAFNPDINTTALIAHGRTPTQGSETDNNNNHPIRVGNIVGVHAGIISNDHTLFKNHSTWIKRKGEVDSEIIFQLLNYYRLENTEGASSMIDAIQRTTPQLTGSFACAVLSSLDKYKLYLFKRSTFLEVFFYSSLGIIVFATSLQSIIKPAMEAVFKGEDLSCERVALEDNTGLSINLKQGSFFRFNIDTSKMKYDENLRQYVIADTY